MNNNNQEKTILISRKGLICPVIIGIILIVIGLCIKTPGGALTTYESLNGDKTDRYVFDDKYSSIDEYVGGDAYNYIIGATLVAGKTAGTMAAKSIFIVGGFLCFCVGLTLLLTIQEENNDSSDELPEL